LIGFTVEKFRPKPTIGFASASSFECRSRIESAKAQHFEIHA
jgi:hypothetical protein